MSSLVAKDNGGGDFELAPAGTHVARCTQVIDLGHQHSEKYNNTSHKILIGWEMPNTDRGGDDPGPWIKWKEYTLSLGERSNLRKDLQSWRGVPFSEAELQGFDIQKVLGATCLITIIHEKSKSNPDRTYAKVASVTSIPSGTQVPDQATDTVFFEIQNWDQKLFDSFSEHLQKQINESNEVKERRNGAAPPAATGGNGQPASAAHEDIPF